MQDKNEVTEILQALGGYRSTLIFDKMSVISNIVESRLEKDLNNKKRLSEK